MIRDTILGHNKIHTLGQKLLSDMGCVYVWGGNQSGLLIDNNLCYNVSSYSCKCSKRPSWLILTTAPGVSNEAMCTAAQRSGAAVVRARRRRLGPLQ